MSIYLALVRMRFVGGLQYRAAALAGMATQFAWGFMETLAFMAFYKVSPGDFPMELGQTVSYIWLQQAFLAMFMMWFYENDIFAAITTGGIAYELARPMDLYNRWFCQSAATRLAKTALRCAPILLVAFVLPAPFRLSLPPGPAQLGLFVLSMALGLMVVVAFTMLVYISAFYTLESTGVRLGAAVLGEFLSGATIPLPFFPEGARRVAELLPFAAMQNMPLRIYTGHIGGMAALRGILLQLFWLAVLILLGKVLMKRALKRVVVQGG